MAIHPRFGVGAISFVPVTLAFAVPLALRTLTLPAARAAARAEHDWLSSQPFGIQNARKAYGRPYLRVEVTFADGLPNVHMDQVKALLLKAAIDGTTELRHGALRIEMKAPSNVSEWNAANACRVVFHDLVTLVLKPVHLEHAISGVSLS